MIKRKPLDLTWNDVALELMSHFLSALAGRADQMRPAAGQGFNVADADPNLRADFRNSRLGKSRIDRAAHASALGQSRSAVGAIKSARYAAMRRPNPSDRKR